MNLFSKAAQNLPLTPAQRAFLKLLKGWFYTALGAGITAGAQYVLGNGQVDWQKLLYLTAGAAILSLLSALDKYWTAQGDLPLALAAQAGEQKVQQAVQAQTQPPAQQPQKAPQPIVLPGVNLPAQTAATNISTFVPAAAQNINATATNPVVPVQQVPFPPAQPLQFPARPQLGTVNLAEQPPASDTQQGEYTRHWGDTGIIPTV